jgi:hypothetical protein
MLQQIPKLNYVTEGKLAVCCFTALLTIQLIVLKISDIMSAGQSNMVLALCYCPIRFLLILVNDLLSTMFECCVCCECCHMFLRPQSVPRMEFGLNYF